MRNEEHCLPSSHVVMIMVVMSDDNSILDLQIDWNTLSLVKMILLFYIFFIYHYNAFRIIIIYFHKSSILIKLIELFYFVVSALERRNYASVQDFGQI